MSAAGPIYAPCSGQSARRAFGRGSSNDWGICLRHDLYPHCPWWRAETVSGSRRTFPTYEAAKRASDQLARRPIDSRLAAIAALAKASGEQVAK